MSIEALYTGELSVRPVGRVGSLAKARKGHYCRSRKYWAIQEFEEKPSPGPNFHHERTDLGKFKTKREANKFLLQAVEVQSATLLYGDENSYVHIQLKTVNHG